MDSDTIILLLPLLLIIAVASLIIFLSRKYSKPVVTTLKNAEWWRRLIGFLIDTLPLMAIAIIIADINRERDYQQQYFAVIYIIYCFLFELLFSRTIGKFITGTIVISQDTLSKPDFGQIFIRSICRIIPFEAFSFIANRPRGWHDSLSRTILVTTKELNNSKNSGTWQVTKKTITLNPLTQLKKLPTGVYRLLIVGWLILPLIVSFISGSVARYDGDEAFLATLISSIIIYYILVRLSIWVYFGFRDDKTIK